MRLNPFVCFCRKCTKPLSARPMGSIEIGQLARSKSQLRNTLRLGQRPNGLFQYYILTRSLSNLETSMLVTKYQSISAFIIGSRQCLKKNYNFELTEFKSLFIGQNVKASRLRVCYQLSPLSSCFKENFLSGFRKTY